MRGRLRGGISGAQLQAKSRSLQARQLNNEQGLCVDRHRLGMPTICPEAPLGAVARSCLLYWFLQQQAASCLVARAPSALGSLVQVGLARVGDCSVVFKNTS